MPQQLTQYLIFINIIFFILIPSAYSETEDIFNNIDSVDTSDETSQEISPNQEGLQNNQIPNNLRSGNAQESRDITNLELKNCSFAKVVALNKITATSQELLLKLNEPQYFGNIQITLHKCLANPDPYNEDAYMLVTINEHKIDEDPTLIFQGWLLSSSLSLSTLEHPVYELFAKECLQEKP